ncbi:ubiquitin carboxyl-terminal hydrolase [Pelomyxa schiedti]|nr:ubiquitin carboxyl-terminal hydrolase [Pelomyxa schiedti]
MATTTTTSSTWGGSASSDDTPSTTATTTTTTTTGGQHRRLPGGGGGPGGGVSVSVASSGCEHVEEYKGARGGGGGGAKGGGGMEMFARMLQFLSSCHSLATPHPHPHPHPQPQPQPHVVVVHQQNSNATPTTAATATAASSSNERGGGNGGSGTNTGGGGAVSWPQAAVGLGVGVVTPQCRVCNSAWGGLHACLECSFFGCLRLGVAASTGTGAGAGGAARSGGSSSSSSGGSPAAASASASSSASASASPATEGVEDVAVDHFSRHTVESGHVLGFDISHKQVWCSACNDYVYDQELESYVSQYLTLRVSPKRSRVATKGNLAVYRGWTAPENELEQQVKLNLIHPGPLFGLRGMYNLGNSCFMSTVLQSLLHNPLLRSYFLADQHNRKLCRQKPKLDLQFDTDRLPAEYACLACEMDTMFQEYFSGNSSPFSPHRFLISIWHHFKNFAGSEQQDSHELFISTLNCLHSHCGGVATDCRCVVHKTFSGCLRSDLTCNKCGFCSTKEEEFFDISLDVSTNNKPTATSNSKTSPPVTLFACLDRYTHKEKLGSTEKIRCAQCQVLQECTKQMSFRMLPNVVVFHLKRFEQHSHKLTKIPTYVEFPCAMNLAPYRTTTVNKPTPVSPPAVSEDTSLYEYDLFAVINHTGEIDQGHYISFFQHKGAWYKCDDVTVTEVTAASVTQSQAYILFYIKKKLIYSNETE